MSNIVNMKKKAKLIFLPFIADYFFIF